MADNIIKPDPSFDIKGTGPATPAPEPITPAAPVALASTSSPQAVKTPEEIEGERLKAAKLAMEGPERTAEREQREKNEGAKAKKGDLEKRLAQIRKAKEKFELAWVDLDEQRKKFKTVLAPVLEQEKQIETEEENTELEEAKTALPAEKHLIEEKRFVIQQKRKQVEDEKWLSQEKVVKLESAIDTNTADYRQLLDEEEGVLAEINKIDASIL